VLLTRHASLGDATSVQLPTGPHWHLHKRNCLRSLGCKLPKFRCLTLGPPPIKVAGSPVSARYSREIRQRVALTDATFGVGTELGALRLPAQTTSSRHRKVHTNTGSANYHTKLAKLRKAGTYKPNHFTGQLSLHTPSRINIHKQQLFPYTALSSRFS
jgi:hypothetical protein